MDMSRQPVLWALMGINVAVYVLWHTFGDLNFEFMRDHFLVSAEGVLSGRVWTLLTSAFSHTEPDHLLFNMLAIWIFGQSVYTVIGGRKFLALYLIGGIAGSIGHVLYGLGSGSLAPALGASGAAMAIAVPYGVWFPRNRLLLFFILPTPAWLAVLLFIVLDILGMVGGGGGIAHAAHLGGAAVGGLMVLAHRRPVVPMPRR